MQAQGTVLQHKPCLRLEAMAQEPVLKKQRVTLERVFQAQGVEQHERIILEYEEYEAYDKVVDATVDGDDIISEKSEADENVADATVGDKKKQDYEPDAKDGTVQRTQCMGIGKGQPSDHKKEEYEYLFV